MMGIRDREAEKIWCRAGDRDRRQIRRFERESERPADGDARSSEYRRKRSVLALLSEAHSGLLDRFIRLGNVFPFGTYPYARRFHLFRRSRHRKNDRRRVERQQLALIAGFIHPTLRARRVLRGKYHQPYRQASTHQHSSSTIR